jgi:hypothetical protein
MSKIKISILLLVVGVRIAIGQEMSADWNRERFESWNRARAEFPGCDETGPFFSRVCEIDSWAKTNDPNFYWNSNKPYLLAQLVQNEIDSKTDTARRDASEGERTNALTQDAASNRQAPIWLGSAIVLSVTFGVAWGLHRIIRPRHGIISAITLGRKWAAWVVAVLTISLLPSFFRKLDGSLLALWVFIVPIFGVTTFLIGWLVGLFKFRKKNTQGHFHKLIIIILSVTYGTVNASSHRDGQTEKIY